MMHTGLELHAVATQSYAADMQMLVLHAIAD
jgi:hypothetical protein